MSLLTQCAVFLLVASLLDLSLAIGRNPTTVEHNACRVKWAEQMNEVKRVYKDAGATIRAFNVSVFPFFPLFTCQLTLIASWYGIFIIIIIRKVWTASPA